MAEGFGKELGRHLFNWFGLIFTVGGSVVALILIKEWCWISVLILLAVATSLGVFSFRNHQSLKLAEAKYQAELNRSQRELSETGDQLRKSQQKLHEVPANILLRLEKVIGAHSIHELTRLFIQQADYVERVRNFLQNFPRTVNLRTFIKQTGNLFTVAKLNVSALGFLRDGDPFFLVWKSPTGLETNSAQVVVHQIDISKETVWFRIAIPLSDDLKHIDNLADQRDVEGIKGYAVQPCCDVARYTTLNVSNLGTILGLLTEDLVRNRG